MTKIISLIILLVVLGGAIIGGRAAYDLARPLSLTEAQRHFEIKPGQTVKQITGSLVASGILADDYWFRVYVWLRRAESQFVAGSFVLPAKLNAVTLLNLLTNQAHAKTRTLKILEGWGIGDITNYLASQGWYKPEDLINLVGRPGVFGSPDNNFYDELAVSYRPLVYRTAGAPLEGYLFPDTYEVFADADIKDVVRKLVANFDRKVTPDLRDEIARQGKSFYKVLIMASIIEAEVPHEADRPIVSDIFWSRLDKGVPLQSDATLRYILGGKRPSLTADELKIDSVYNTYKNKGLPPTPIGNPGLSAIKAAIYPAKTDYFYFLSTPEGQTIFSKTLAEHNRAKQKYLK